MPIVVTVYDFFGYTLPGAVYIFVGTHIYNYFSNHHLNLLGDNLFEFGIFVGASFIVGYLMDFVSFESWYRIFNPRERVEEGLRQVNENSPNKIRLENKGQWAIILNYVRIENEALASISDKLMATTILLGNISFALALFAAFQIYIICSTNLLVPYIGYALAAIIFSIVAGLEARRFHIWYHINNFQAAASLLMKKEDFLEKKSRKKKGGG